MSQLTEEEQVKIATRMGLISTLPLFKFDEGKREKLSECIICMCEYEEGEELRYLPCLHTYHRVCIDDWLMRALTCPSCLEEIRPSSPPVQRDPPHISTDSTPLLHESLCHNSERSDSTAAVPDTVPSTLQDSEVPRDSQNRGDSLSVTPEPLPELNEQDPVVVSHSSSAEVCTPKPQSSDRDNNNRHDSGGDGTRGWATTPLTIAASEVPVVQPQHRRTRSNEHGEIQTGSFVSRGRPAHRSEQYQRRGHSVSGLDRVVVPLRTSRPEVDSEAPVASNELAISSGPDPVTPVLPAGGITATRSLEGSGPGNLWPFHLDGDSSQPQS
ncbi:RING finger protein 11 [Fasciola hepatica]|uniref:RING finger protein 11 n=1 Tax=Fasciola hepatica TaxID=6192 RepID=A0A4E0RSR6_FASHE|nr:RING finger protein 11 [Fasciola hepatica]